MNPIRTTLFALAAIALPFGARAESAKPDSSETKPTAKFKWQSDYAKALKLAKEEKKPVVILFTNPSWCHYCVDLEKTHIASKEFKPWAADKAIFVKLDKFPSGKPTTAEEKKTSELAKKFGVSGIPAWISVDADGNKLGRDGYRAGPTKEYLSGLESSLKLDAPKPTAK